MHKFINRIKNTCLLLAMINTIGSIPIGAQEKNYDDMTLEDLLNIELSVASKKNLTSRESPGIVTFITQEEIQKSGARDLIDVLSSVQGFVFVGNVQGTVGTSLRGFDGQGGKILFMIDGMPMPELFYGTLAFGNHYSVDQIKKIEIIRGPGSTIYGGFAELAVINVITKNGEDLQGTYASVTYGQMAKSYARRNINIQYGNKTENFKFSILGFFGQGIRSDRNYTDYYGNSYNMKDNSGLNPLNVNVNFDYKKLSMRFISDHYDIKQRDEFGANLAKPVHTTFSTYVADLKYDWSINEKLSITPSINYTQQTPWKEDVDTVLQTYAYDRTVHRISGAFTTLYQPNKKITITGGAQVYKDRAIDKLNTFKNGKDELEFTNIAAFSELLWNNSIANFAFGSRFENHSQAGSSFVPRFAISKSLNRLSVKLIYSEAFRAPTIEENNLSKSIKPEKTTVVEFEAGYQLNTDMNITTNFFNSVIKDIILYEYIADTQTETYRNAQRSGTQGFELDFRWRKKWGYLNTNYSYYQAYKNRISDFDVPGHKNMLLAFPSHKIAANASYRISNYISVNPSITYYSEKYGFIGVDNDDKPVLHKYKPSFIANLSVMNEDFIVNGLSLQASVFDIFGANYKYIFPHGGHGAVPATSREMALKICYQF